MAITVRLLQAPDIPAVFAIQSASPEAAQWPELNYRALEQSGELAWVAEMGGAVVGFLAARHIRDEVEILNLAVLPEFRRKGVATNLLAVARDSAKTAGVKKMFLEVRSANPAARRFYERHGFHAAGLRRNYYSDPPDDAILLSAPVRLK